MIQLAPWMPAAYGFWRSSKGGKAMTTAFGITLLIGMGLGLVLGVPVGRFWERVRPSKRDEDAKKKKK